MVWLTNQNENVQQCCWIIFFLVSQVQKEHIAEKKLTSIIFKKLSTFDLPILMWFKGGMGGRFSQAGVYGVQELYEENPQAVRV